MAAWVVVPNLLALRAEFNELVPGRDKGADGTIGDSAHTSRSDHTPDEDSTYLRDHDPDNKNEVHALDIDSSGPWSGTGTQKQRFHAIVMRIIAGERAKWLDPNDVCRLEYVIWDRKIYSRSNDFEPRNYTGSDPHTNHAHFSSRYLTTSENDVRPWGVLPVAPAKPDSKDDDMQEYIASIARAVRGDAGATAQDRQNRADLAATLRFVAGLNFEDQTAANLPLGPAGVLNRIADALAPAETPES